MTSALAANRPQDINLPAIYIAWHKDPETQDSIGLTLQNLDTEIILPQFYSKYKVDVLISTELSAGANVELYLQFNGTTFMRSTINDSSSNCQLSAFIESRSTTTNKLKVLCLRKGNDSPVLIYDAMLFITKSI